MNHHNILRRKKDKDDDMKEMSLAEFMVKMDMDEKGHKFKSFDSMCHYYGGNVETDEEGAKVCNIRDGTSEKVPKNIKIPLPLEYEEEE